MHSNVHSPKSNTPPSADLFSEDRWRNIQQIIRQTFLRFNDVLQSMDTRIDIIQRTQRADRDQLIDKMLSLTNQQRTLSEKIDKLDIIIEEKIVKAMKTVDVNQYIENRYGMGGTTFKSSHEQLVRQLNNYGGNKVLRPLPVQELYLESNQTMFGMVTEEISKLKQQQQILVENVTRKNKATISISNEMCAKLEGIQREIALLKKKQEYMARLGVTSDEKCKSKTKSNDFYENLKITNLSQIIAELQQQLHEKAYLKDITQIIRSSMLPLEESVETMRLHFESNISSTNKILNHQSIINEELCREMKVGRWEWVGVTVTKMGTLVWEKQLINLYPESLMWSKNTSSLVVRQPGIYKFQVVVFAPQGINPQVSLIVNRRECRYKKDQEQRFGHLYIDIVKIQKNSNISVSCDTKVGAAILTIRRI